MYCIVLYGGGKGGSCGGGKGGTIVEKEVAVVEKEVAVVQKEVKVVVVNDGLYKRRGQWWKRRW